MKIEYLDTLPPGTKPHNNLRAMLDEFDRTDKNVMKIAYKECNYRSPSSCASSIYKAIKTRGRTWKVRMIEGEIYIIKKNED